MSQKKINNNLKYLSDLSSVAPIYQSLLVSENQIAEGKIHDAKESLNKLRDKYSL